MKEFVAQVGGRYTYIDDILNLQDLSLAFTHLFDGCDDFVLSGCEVKSTAISSGFVYINGKIRYYEGIGNTTFPAYIYEKNSVENVPYADSETKEGCRIYGTALSNNVPTVPDTITGKAPAYIVINSDGKTKRLADAFFAKYAVTLDDIIKSQTINKDLNVNGKVDAKELNVTDVLSLLTGNDKANVKFLSGKFVIETLPVNGIANKITLNPDGTICFYSNDKMLLTMTDKEVVASVPFKSGASQFGNIQVNSGQLYDYTTMSDEGCVKINMLSTAGGSTYYRNFFVGDGKNKVLFEINGKQSRAAFQTQLQVSPGVADGLILKHPTLAQSDALLSMKMSWSDKNNNIMASIGYVNTTDTNWHIHNNIGNIILDNDTYVTGKLVVKGIDIGENMYNRADALKALELKADKTDVYTKREADDTFAKNTDISVFVNKQGGGTTGMDKVCQSIGAARSTEVLKYVKKDQLFKDIVAEGLSTDSPTFSEEQANRQKELCSNIGAAYRDDLQKYLKNTGWVSVWSNTLKARQVGYVVCVAGELTVTGSLSSLFRLPDEIDAPTQTIEVNVDDETFKFKGHIEAGTKECVGKATASGYRGQRIPFTLTYLI